MQRVVKNVEQWSSATSVIIVKQYLVLDFVLLAEFVPEKSQKYVQIAGLHHLALFVQLADFALVQARLRRKELTLVVDCQQ